MRVVLKSAAVFLGFTLGVFLLCAIVFAATIGVCVKAWKVVR